MGIIKAFSGALSGAFADQWKELITAASFDEHVAVVPGLIQRNNNGRGGNEKGSFGVISNGSKIFVPENCAAFIFSQAGIEEIILEPGGYEYQNGEESIFDGDGAGSLASQVKDRIGFGGMPEMQKKIAFVNLREIRGLQFETKGPQIYNDLFYGCDLEVLAFGTFSVQVTNPTVFIRNFVPANLAYYTFDNNDAKAQITAELLQSFNVALNSLSSRNRISQLPSQSQEISEIIAADSSNAGTWEERFGFKVVKVAVENIEFTDESKELINQYSTNKMNLKAYEDVSKKASDISAQQKIAEGIMDNGMGDMGGMVFGMNMAQGLGLNADLKADKQSIDDQIETLKKLKELLDIGVLTQEEFDKKKKEIMGL